MDLTLRPSLGMNLGSFCGWRLWCSNALQPLFSYNLTFFACRWMGDSSSVLGTLLIILGLLLVSWAREEAMRLAALSAIVERSNRLPKATAEALVPGLRAPLLQVKNFLLLLSDPCL